MFDHGSPSFDAVLDAFRAEEVESVGDAALVEGFAALHRAGEAIEAERLRRLAEIERRGLHHSDGYLSTKAWLSDRFRLAPGAAKEQVKVAHALAEMPEVRESFSAGQMSSSAVRVLAAARESNPATFAEQESALVEAATTRSVCELRRVVWEWSQAVDADGGLARAERLYERRRLDLCPTPDGTVHVQGELDPESGEAVMTAIGAICDAAVRSGLLGLWTPGQLRADALADLAGLFLADQDRASVGGGRPHINVTVDLLTLAGLDPARWPAGRTERGDPGLAESARADVSGRSGSARSAVLDHVGAIPAETARRLACNGTVRRVVLDPRSQPLDVGRQTEVVPAGLRTALVVRDGRCRFPRCDRPPPWCQPHHIVHWTRDGATSLGNLVLLCGRHHRLVHEGGFGVRMTPDGPAFTRPDGSPL